MPDPTTPVPAPPPLTVAASLVAVQGLVLVVLAVAELVSLSPDRRAMGLSTAGFFAAYGVVLLAAGWALWRAVGWSRGPVLLTQLIWLGLAWNLRDNAVLAIAVALTALVVLAGLLHPASVAALDGERFPVDES